MQMKVEGQVFLDGKRGKKVSMNVMAVAESFDKAVDYFVDAMESQYSENHMVDDVFVDRITVLKTRGKK